MKNKLYTALMVGGFLLSSVAAAEAQVAAGGNFTLEQTAVAAGGATNSTGGQFALGGTTGQAIAGQTASNAPFAVHAGFWNPAAFAPTAANVAVGGRVLTANGRGIRSVRVTMTGANGATRTAISTAFGYFRFDGVAAGETYVFSASAKRFQLSQPIVVRTISEDTGDIDFTAVEDF